jgi:hypothetical protein
MRAICEGCARPQPVDWKPGGICIHCGQAVRPEVRCFWCVKWTPAAGKYCRSCGAAVVESRLFGAARMLKDAGVDRFGIPKMLAELDPGQIENFTNIYQRHAAVMARHVDHVRFLETFLQDKNWSSVLEETLIPQLPWPEERLAEYSPPLYPEERPVSGVRTHAESRALARIIGTIAPFALTRSLAPLVRLMLEDWEVHRDAQAVLYASDPRLQGEAALALSHWRVVYGPGIPGERYRIIDALRASLFPFRSAVHLAMLAADGAVLPPEAISSSDPDIAFMAALAMGDVDRLVAAGQSPDPLQRYVAAWRLCGMGHFIGVSEVLRAADAAQQIDLMQTVLRAKKPPFELRDVCFELLENHPEERVRKNAARVLSACWQPGDALRIGRAARGESQIYQSILQTKEIPPEELDRFCGFLVERGEFNAGQWGMSDAARPGHVPASFVPCHWPDASAAARIELCKFAEMQLEQSADEDLHRFLVHTIFRRDVFDVQQTAWTCLYRWYGRSDHTRMGALLIQAEPLRRFFGSVTAFVPVLADFLGNGNPPAALLHDVFVREPVAKLLRYAEPDVVPEMEQAPRQTFALADALRGVMRDTESDLMVRLACIDLMAMLAASPVLRPKMVEILQSFRRTDLDHGASMGLERIQRYETS